MTYQNVTGAMTLAAALLASSAAFADITAEEVWQGWVSYYEDMGQTVSVGTKTMQADTLVISDAVFAATMPDGSFSVTIGEIRLREMGDGRVDVTVSEEIPMRMLSNASAGENVDIGMKVTHSGLSTIVSGSTVDTTYDFTATNIGIAFDGMSVDGSEMPMLFDMSLDGVGGNYRMISNDNRQISSDLRADALNFSLSGQDPESGGSIKTSGQLSGVSGTSMATIPSGLDFTDMNAMLRAGMSAGGGFAYASGGYTMEFDDAGETVSVNTSGQGGALDFSMSQAGLSYGINGGAGQVAILASAFPVPIDASLTSSAFSLAMPVAQSDADQPFSLVMKLVDLKVSDGLWNMIDPGVQLPRDPATLIVDISGAAKLLMDIFDPANAESMNAAPPGELTSLDINELKVSAVGAELTGTGAMTFQNNGPVPQPVGAVDMQLIGGNGLIDKLVAMGFVPEDQAMGARMMMGLFAVMSGEDTLTSKIEFKEDGAILANGQRIQ